MKNEKKKWRSREIKESYCDEVGGWKVEHWKMQLKRRSNKLL